MRLFPLIASLLLVTGLSACKKDAPQEAAHACGDGFQSATVVLGGLTCNANGYLIQLAGGTTYVPDGLPVSLQQNGLKVCVMYTIYADPRTCACCGGTRMRIQQVKQQ